MKSQMRVAAQIKAAKVSAAKRRRGDSRWLTARSRDKVTASKMGSISPMQKKSVGDDMRSWGTARISSSRTRGWTDGVTKERAKSKVGAKKLTMARMPLTGLVYINL